MPIWLAALLGLAAALYTLHVALLWLGQRRILYKPDPAPPLPPPAAPPDRRDLATVTDDGLRLHHWIWPAPADDRPILVVFHGNAGNRGGTVAKYERAVAWGCGLVLTDYRGYGGNPGRPTEPGLIRDGLAVVDALTAQGVAPARLVLHGESLGSGVATAVAAQRPVGGLILEAPFDSIAALAQRIYWYTPAKWLLRDPWDSAARIGAVRCPILVLHGGQDTLIPPLHGRRLFDAAPEPKSWRFFEAGDHLDLWERGAAEAVRDFLEARR
jgi:hypothetical protein